MHSTKQILKILEPYPPQIYRCDINKIRIATILTITIKYIFNGYHDKIRGSMTKMNSRCSFSNWSLNTTSSAI